MLSFGASLRLDYITQQIRICPINVSHETFKYTTSLAKISYSKTFFSYISLHIQHNHVFDKKNKTQTNHL